MNCVTILQHAGQTLLKEFSSAPHLKEVRSWARPAFVDRQSNNLKWVLCQHLYYLVLYKCFLLWQKHGDIRQQLKSFWGWNKEKVPQFTHPHMITNRFYFSGAQMNDILKNMQSKIILNTITLLKMKVLNNAIHIHIHIFTVPLPALHLPEFTTAHHLLVICNPHTCQPSHHLHCLYCLLYLLVLVGFVNTVSL